MNSNCKNNDVIVSKEEIFELFDSLTADRLHTQGQLKWNLYPDCIGAWIAETDYGTSPVVAKTLHEAIDSNLLGYMPAGLFSELKETCAKYQYEKFGWNITSKNIFLLPDVLTCLHIMLDDFIPPNSSIIVLTPSYMPFLTIPGEHNHNVIQIPAIVDETNTYRIDMEKLEEAFQQGAKLLILCNPWNPIGRVLCYEELEKISEIVDKYDGIVFNDEIHSPLALTEEKKHINYPNINAKAASRSITATAASKGWNIAGLKSAQVIITDEKLAEKFAPISEKYTKFMPPIGVIAALSAYTDKSGWIEAVKEYVLDNALYLEKAIKDIPEIEYIKPEGTYLAWVKINNFESLAKKYFTPEEYDSHKDDCKNIADLLRENLKLAVVSGCACGEGFKNCIRLNMAMPRPLLHECVENLITFVQSDK